MWHPTTNRFLNSRHVKFNEKLTYKNIKELDEIRATKEKESIPTSNDSVELENSTTENSPQKRKRKSQAKIDEKSTARKQPKRTAKTNHKIVSVSTAKVYTEEENDKHQKNDEAIFANLAKILGDPKSYKEILEREDKDAWVIAVDNELESMKENDVWDIVDRPSVDSKGKKIKVIDSKWVFKIKSDSEGTKQEKARLVIRGFKDNNEYELQETYAPVSRQPVIRATLAVTNKYELDAYHLDVKTAFLNGDLKQVIYMEIPEGVGYDKKAIHGLRVSPKRWNIRLTKEAKILGLENDLNEPCVFTWRKNGNDAEKIQEVKNHFGE